MIQRAKARPQLAAILAVAAIGFGYVAVRTFAAGSFSSLEPENGTVSSLAAIVNSTGASGGKAVKFGVGASPSPTPIPGKPTAANTGVPVGATLTVSNGDRTYSTDGQVISGLDIHGYVYITGKNVTIKNSILRGGTKTCTSTNAQNSAVLYVDDKAGAANVVVQDSELAPSYATACLDGVWGANLTLLRMNIHGSVDGVKAFDNTTIQDSYIHDMAHFSSDPNQGGGPTHNDGVQTYECNKNIRLYHNNIDMPGDGTANAAYQISQDGGVRCSNIAIDTNWLNGGGCTLNLAPGSLGTLTGISIVNNRFGRARVYTDCTIKAYAGTTLAAYSGNVWDDTGLPIPSPQP